MRIKLLLLIALLAAACSNEQARLQLGDVEPLPSPAGPHSGEPNLFASDDGRVFLTWIEQAQDGPARLLFSTLDDNGWTVPRLIAQGADWFVNWADFPALVAHPGDHLTAHFLQKSAASTYAYDVKVTRSEDGGTTWSEALAPHDDGTPTEHGFVSLVPWQDGQTLLVWLDGREMAGGHGHDGGGAMTLRAALLDPQGALSQETILDEKTCDCCQTAAVRTPRGALVAYRDRSEDEIRDIKLLRFDGAAWSEPYALHDDGWEIPGCPVNGPALAAHGAHVAAAWFTAANDTPRVHLAFSDDAGQTFAPPVRIDEGRPLGRVDLTLLADGSALVVWLEATDETAALRLRRVAPDGAADTTFTLTPTSPARASGFPHLARTEDAVIFAWTDAEAAQVRTAVLRTK